MMVYVSGAIDRYHVISWPKDRHVVESFTKNRLAKETSSYQSSKGCKAP